MEQGYKMPYIWARFGARAYIELWNVDKPEPKFHSMMTLEEVRAGIDQYTDMQVGVSKI